MMPPAPTISAELSTTLQPLGGLIACEVAGDRVTHACAAISEVFGTPPDGMLGSRLEEVLPRELRHNLRNILSLRRYKDGRHFLGRYDLPAGIFDASVSCSVATEHLVFEFEPATEALQTADDFAAELRHLSDELRLADSDGKLLDGLAGLLRVATGYDSAAIYRFGENGGEVVAEARNSARRRLLGQRLPQLEAQGDAQTDGRRPIPHFVADAGAPQNLIHATGGAERGLDLFYCHLRGVSAGDAAMTSELGVTATMTVPLVMNSGLWGMALLLNRAPRTPTRYIRQLCDALASVVCDRMQILHLSVAMQPSRPASRTSAPKADLSGKTVLVIEDNRLVAADLKLALLDLGFEAVDLFADEASALSFMASHRVDLAVLDIHLEGDATSFAVARKLAGEGTPFLFLSGYGATDKLPSELGDRPVALKPATRRKLSAEIDELLVGAPPPQAKA